MFFFRKFLMGISIIIIPCSFSLESLSQNRLHQPPHSLFNEGSKYYSVQILRMIPYFFFTEVKCKGNTQITHMVETKKLHQVITLFNDQGKSTCSATKMGQFTDSKTLCCELQNILGTN